MPKQSLSPRAGSFLKWRPDLPWHLRKSDLPLSG
jgi:hypothetical protein